LPATPEVGETVSFTVASSSANGSTLTQAFVYGDGSSGANATHVYAAAGTFTVVVTVSDGVNAAVTATASVTVAALPPPPAGAGDADGDGVSNENELADGTNPLDPTSAVKTPLPITKVQGKVSYKASNADSVSISGTISKVPAKFSPLGIPANTFSVGGPGISIPVFGTAAPAPGSYGNVSIDRGTLELSPGKYFFNSVTATSGFMNLNLRLDKPGDIELYVLGDYNIPLQVTQVNGVAVSAADAALASRVFVESHGNVFVGWDNLGTLYAPAGDVTLDSLTDLWGQVIAGHDAIFGGGADVQFVASAHLPTAVPEPATIALFAMGMALVIAVRFGRGRAGRILASIN